MPKTLLPCQEAGEPLTISYHTKATIASGVGTYAITAAVSGAAAGDYAVTVVPGTLTVTKAPLMVHVKNATRAYGTPNPKFSGTVTGLLNGDKVTVTYSTTATINSPAGTYPIKAKVSGTRSVNYLPTIKNGTLTVTPAS